MLSDLIPAADFMNWKHENILRRLVQIYLHFLPIEHMPFVSQSVLRTFVKFAKEDIGYNEFLDLIRRTPEFEGLLITANTMSTVQTQAVAEGFLAKK